jgi:hypothetical protein
LVHEANEKDPIPKKEMGSFFLGREKIIYLYQEVVLEMFWRNPDAQQWRGESQWQR